MTELFRRFDGYDELKPLIDASDEQVLVRLGRPALIRIPALDGEPSDDERPRARLVACLLHGNEESGFRAVLELLRSGARFPFDLWVFVGNVRAAMTGGWFAHRYLDDQEDFNRVWALGEPTTRMRRCADAVLSVLKETDLEAALDLHNNTGASPPYAIVPQLSPESVELARVCSDLLLHWGQRLHTLMEALVPHCPAVAMECGMAGVPQHAALAADVLRRFLGAPTFGTDPADLRWPDRVYELRERIIVRSEVPFAFGGGLTDELDFVIAPQLDTQNFGMLLAGTGIGRVHPGAAMPLRAVDVAGRDMTEQLFALRRDGVVVLTQDITPVMMTTTVQQARRDCLFYVARRRA